MSLTPTEPATPTQRRKDVFVLLGCLGFLVVLGVCFMIFLYPQLAKKVPDSLPSLPSLPKSTPKPDDALTVAAKKNEAWAQHLLGVQYSTGTDRSEDMELAAQWFRRAADQEHADAQFQLGLLYETGEGVEANLSEAYYWVLRSEQNSNQLARAKLNALAARLSQSEIERAKQRAGPTKE